MRNKNIAEHENTQEEIKLIFINQHIHCPDIDTSQVVYGKDCENTKHRTCITITDNKL